MSAPGPGQQIAERGYNDPELDSRYGPLQKRYLDAYDAWVAAGRPEVEVEDEDGNLYPIPDPRTPAGRELTNATRDYDEFTGRFGVPKNRQNETDAAQQAFENSIDLGDFELRKADAAYTRWLNRTKAAEAGAQGEIEAAQAQNDSAATAMEDYMASNFTAPPRSTSVRLIEPYEKVIDKWNKKLGVGEAPGMEAGSSGIGLPPRAPATGGGFTPREEVDTMGGFNPFANGRADSGFYGRDASVRGTNDAFYGSQESRMPEEPRPRGYQGAAGGANRSAGRAFNPFSPITKAAGSAAKNAPGKAKKWWQKVPGFANGVQNFEGGPAMLGERGPEIVEIPGFGEFEVGQNGPEERVLPPGSNVIPMSEQLVYSQIKQAAREPRGVDRMKKQQEAMMRRQDPMLQEKVMAALQKAQAANMVVNPPTTPMLSPDWQGSDPWEQLRPLSGVPAVPQPAQPQQGAPR